MGLHPVQRMSSHARPPSLSPLLNSFPFVSSSLPPFFPSFFQLISESIPRQRTGRKQATPPLSPSFRPISLASSPPVHQHALAQRRRQLFAALLQLWTHGWRTLLKDPTSKGVSESPHLSFLYPRHLQSLVASSLLVVAALPGPSLCN